MLQAAATDAPPRFANRRQAGRLLARHLLDYRGRADALVLALPRGGVPVGFEVALALQLPLDILVVRKIGFPGHPEYALGAVAGGGGCFVQAGALAAFGIAREFVELAVRRQLREIEQRERRYRAGHPACTWRDRQVIVVDDGLATGSTMKVALGRVRAAQAARAIVAVPAGSAEACAVVAASADELICLATPAPFHSVGACYDDFAQTSEEEVMSLLAQSRKRPVD